MMKILAHLIHAIAVMACIVAAPVHAGRSCETAHLDAATLERSLDLAQRTAAALDASGQQVVLLARVGQDLSKYGQHYSHLGFAYRQADGRGGHVWRVLHKLNQCGANTAAIYRQGLGEFFLDNLWRYEAGFAAPNREWQERLLPLLENNARALAVHEPAYSTVSYAWGRKYQQSNQWAIETMAVAMLASPASRARAQGWLLAQGYEPGVLRLGPLTRLGGRMSSANVAFDDHPPEKRFADRIETVTADSVFLWLRRSSLGSPATLVMPGR
jgi:hypothetical protein